MSRQPFSEIYARAASRHGGADEVESRLPQPLSAKRLRSLGDDRLLSQMAKCVFRAGFVWRVVEAKWPGFEEAFFGFDPQTIASMSDRDLGALSEDRRSIRNPIKIRSVRDSATFVVDTAEEHGRERPPPLSDQPSAVAELGRGPLSARYDARALPSRDRAAAA